MALWKGGSNVAHTASVWLLFNSHFICSLTFSHWTAAVGCGDQSSFIATPTKACLIKMRALPLRFYEYKLTSFLQIHQYRPTLITSRTCSHTSIFTRWKCCQWNWEETDSDSTLSCCFCISFCTLSRLCYQCLAFKAAHTVCHHNTQISFPCLKLHPRSPGLIWICFLVLNDFTLKATESWVHLSWFLLNFGWGEKVLV